ncbi:hypothetical protein [Herminiimonas fonticola]|uniref:Uncharacterized protein n=1 Tax=Herminiimonas fonticola TaxID=303380 RepID=A0A4R6GI49_9BURK|nr:hypothetical protein [Herminiimonas fonticola]RBA25513.1 hypothetical protein Hfont_1146 [Herminiimonas fonticola]TDN94626.1 hypothetical protein EV677_1178 [Herminiimonas fonticola]
MNQQDFSQRNAKHRSLKSMSIFATFKYGNHSKPQHEHQETKKFLNNVLLAATMDQPENKP